MGPVECVCTNLPSLRLLLCPGRQIQKTVNADGATRPCEASAWSHTLRSSKLESACHLQTVCVGKLSYYEEAPPFKIFPDFKSDFSNSRDPSPSTNRTKRQMPGQGAAAVKARPNVRTDAKGSHAGQRSNKAEEYDMLVDQALTIIGSQPSQTLGTCSCSQH